MLRSMCFSDRIKNEAHSVDKYLFIFQNTIKKSNQQKKILANGEKGILTVTLLHIKNLRKGVSERCEYFIIVCAWIKKSAF